jgi:hypothetical protein
VKVWLGPRWLNLAIIFSPVLYLRPQTAMVIIPGAYLSGLYETQRLKPRYTMMPYWVALVLTTVLSWSIAGFIWSRPLPDATITTDSAIVLSGKLIAATGDNAYLSINGPGKTKKIVATPASTIRRLEITPVHSTDPRTLGEVILDLVRDRLNWLYPVLGSAGGQHPRFGGGQVVDVEV